MAAKARLILGWAAALGVLGLAVTGIWLGFFYKPTAALALDDIDGLNRQIEWGIRVRGFHQQLSLVVPILIVVWLILAVAARLQKRGLLLAGSLGATLVAVTSGLVTPWRHGQLTSFTTGTNMFGFEPVRDEDLTFVLLDGTQISSTEIRGWATVHLLAGLVVAVLVGFALLSNRRASPRTPGEAEQPEPASLRA